MAEVQAHLTLEVHSRQLLHPVQHSRTAQLTIQVIVVRQYSTHLTKHAGDASIQLLVLQAHDGRPPLACRTQLGNEDVNWGSQPLPAVQLDHEACEVLGLFVVLSKMFLTLAARLERISSIANSLKHETAVPQLVAVHTQGHEGAHDARRFLRGFKARETQCPNLATQQAPNVILVSKVRNAERSLGLLEGMRYCGCLLDIAHTLLGSS
mmetsp:Transcript_7014/g.11924  ORF Transcript_7014/g.11924 Transcript_7014/m.11924 type:complete len:209 (-) Transcript_7014:129-755(-)